MVVCGKRGGPNFIDSVRIGSGENRCPEGLQPCSKQTQISETICMEPEKIPAECPILDLVLATKS